jgi:carboxymethylenebutenolidase
MAKFDEITVDGSPMKIFVARPEGEGPFPAVLLMFHRAGIDEFTRDRAERLAAEGFIAAAPDLFHRWPDADNPLERMDDNELGADVIATAAHVRGLAECNGKLAIGGHCMGGRVAFLGAEVSDAFSAATIFYCGGMFTIKGKGEKSPFEMLDRVTCPVAGFFGNDDKNPSPDDVNRIDAALTEFGIEHEFYHYDGAGHAFQNFVREDVYREAAEKDSWTKAVAFLKAKLG